MKQLVPLAMIAALAACSSEGSKDDMVGMANPASVYCVEQGGTSKIVKAADGSESGVCVLPDGSEVDEWEYFRANNPE